MHSDLIEIASWRIVSELFRRYPNKFTLIQIHPGGGQYNCLSLFDKQSKEHLADFNRPGSLHIFSGEQSSSDIWSQFLSRNSKNILDEVCRILHLPPINKLPMSTPATLTYRFIATFLTHSTFGIHSWKCENGNCDTSGYGGGVVKDFEFFPQALDKIRKRPANSTFSNPAYDFWFLKKDGQPFICLETSGSLWLQNKQNDYSLDELYNNSARNIWATVTNIAGTIMR